MAEYVSERDAEQVTIASNEADTFPSNASNATTLAGEEEVASESSAEEAINTTTVVEERDNFIEECRVSREDSSCPCSLPPQNRTFHHPICGTITKTRATNCHIHKQPHVGTWLPPRWSKAPGVSFEFWLFRKPQAKPRMKHTIIRRHADNGEFFENVRKGDIARTRALLETDKYGIEDIGQLTGFTALHWAVRMIQAPMIQFLLSQGANPFYDFMGAMPPTCHLAWDYWLRSIISKERGHLMRPLLACSNFMDYLRLSEMSKTLVYLSTELFTQHFPPNIDDIQYQDGLDRTILSWASAMGASRCVSYLLAYGSDPNVQDKFHKTPLHLALDLQRPKTFYVVKRLLRAGANPDPNPTSAKIDAPLLFAARYIEDPRVLAILLQNKANVNARTINGLAALHLVAYHKLAEHTALLISYGAKIDLKDWTGRTALDVALAVRNIEVINYYRVALFPPALLATEPELEAEIAATEFENLTIHFEAPGERPPRFFAWAGILGSEAGFIEVPELSERDWEEVRDRLDNFQEETPAGLAERPTHRALLE